MRYRLLYRWGGGGGRRNTSAGNVLGDRDRAGRDCVVKETELIQYSGGDFSAAAIFSPTPTHKKSRDNPRPPKGGGEATIQKISAHKSIGAAFVLFRTTICLAPLLNRLLPCM